MKIMADLGPVLCGGNLSQSDAVTVIELIITTILPLLMCHFK